MRLHTSVLAVFFILLSSAPSRAARIQPAPQPAMFRGSPNHDGVYAGAAPRNLRALKWHFKTGGKVRSSPAIADGVVYVASEDGFLYALDAQTGALRWKVATGGNATSSPAVAGSSVFVAGGDGRVYSVRADTGRLQWTFQPGSSKPYLLFGSDPRAYDYWASSPAVVDGALYVGSADGNLYALDASTGRLRWKAGTGAAVRSSPAVADGTVFVGSLDGTLRAVDAKTGAPAWTFKAQGNAFFTEGAIQSSPAVVDGTVFVGSRDGLLYAVDALTGRQRWLSDHQMAWVNASPAVAAGLVVAGDSDGQSVVAVDVRTGVERWRYKTNGRVFSSAAVAGGRVYVGNSFGVVYVLDLQTGALLDQAFAEAGVHSSPAIASGVLYVGSDDSMVYAFTERPEPPRVPVQLPDALLARYEGSYYFSPQMAFTVKRRSPGRIAVSIGDRPALEMVAGGEAEFFHEKADLQVRFATDGAGAVTELVFLQAGFSSRLKRMNAEAK